MGEWLHWNDDTVPRIAQGIYDDRRPDGTLDAGRMAILADALLDAGCEDEGLMMHLRGLEVCPRCLGCGASTIMGPVRLMSGKKRRSQLKTFLCPEPCDNGWIPIRSPHCRGCWAIDLLLGKS